MSQIFLPVLLRCSRFACEFRGSFLPWKYVSVRRTLLKRVDGVGYITGVALRSTESNYRWLLIFSEARLMCGSFSRGIRLLEGLISASKDGCCTSP